MKDTILNVNHIDIYYGDIKALHDVSFSVCAGEIVSLLGSNGAGKSTVLKAIAGLLKPKQGNIVFNGMDLTDLPVHKVVDLGICLVPEEKQVFGTMTVLENLELGAFVPRARKSREQTLAFVYELFPKLEARKGQKAGTLSGGEQKMVLIGRALMSQPRLLLIDELSLGLAPVLVESFFRVVKALNESTGLTVLLVEQNVKNALELSESACIIENGCILAEGRSCEFLDSQQMIEDRKSVV